MEIRLTPELSSVQHHVRPATIEAVERPETTVVADLNGRNLVVDRAAFVEDVGLDAWLRGRDPELRPPRMTSTETPTQADVGQAGIPVQKATRAAVNAFFGVR